jgi:hypothetical protein
LGERDRLLRPEERSGLDFECRGDFDLDLERVDRATCRSRSPALSLSISSRRETVSAETRGFFSPVAFSLVPRSVI